MITLLTLIDNETDQERFMRIYEQYKQSIFSAAYKILGDDGLAEDTVQETFLRIATNITKYDFNHTLVMTIARNAALNILAKQKKEIVVDDIEAVSSNDIPSGGYNYDIKKDIERVYEIVSTMPEIYADVFLLKYSHNLKYSEIGSLLGITVSTAKKRVQRAKEYIRNAVEREKQNNEAD